ncbi:histidine phosphatase family protein [Acinetobacter sp. MB5]|uniref:histidine phosphatase family protein n=1 Tax=Acinetobacter sp. MB5 TaxID=2069438 RepID=UPI000DCF9A86|nr:histidine phosphatase family protein [Acinetobacter sp. MB5]
MLQLDVLRHGQTTQGHTLRGYLDDALTAEGWQQMQETIAVYVQQHCMWDAIVTSPLQRCLSFAQDVQQQFDLPLVVMPEFKELNFGVWEGLTVQHIHETQPDLLGNFWQDPCQYAPPQGENLAEFQARLQQGFQELLTQAQQQQWQSILLVSHGGVIKWLKCMAHLQPITQLLSMSAELASIHSILLSRNQDLSLHIQEKTR